MKNEWFISTLFKLTVGIRKVRGVGGGGTHVNVAEARIGTTGIP